jgi:phenylacetic acid degradation operon negative regulatory protein
MKPAVRKGIVKNNKSLSIVEFLESYFETKKLHPKSLISTLFGDLGVPHGGKIWVSIISALLEPAGISERLVRTSLFRLVEENWLASTRVGRKSYYQLSSKALGQTRLAESLIYHRHQRKWDGKWTLVFIIGTPLSIDLRTQLAQELKWIGFGAVSRNIYAHPNASIEVVAGRVKALKLSKNVVCMKAENVSDDILGLDVSNSEMAEMCFSVIDLQDRYSAFIDQYSQLDLKSVRSSTSQNQLLLRLLLIDEYRRIVLSDPHLPDQLLPINWRGGTAHALSKKIYGILFATTNNVYSSLVDQAGSGLISEFNSEFSTRFSR